MIDNISIGYGWENALCWALQAAKALRYMHHWRFSKYVHRDIKPANMILDESYQTLKLCDFVTMKKITPSSDYGTSVYMAPEVYDDEYTEKSDVYSWALSLVHCLERKSPYSYCRNEIEIEHAKQNSEYYKLSTEMLSENKIVSQFIHNLIKMSTFSDHKKRISIDDIVKCLNTFMEHFEIPSIQMKQISCKFHFLNFVYNFFH